MTADALFPDHLVPRSPPMTADQRRTARQARAIANRSHPLALVHGPEMYPRHSGTYRQEYAASDPKGRALTCGTCQHRELVAHHDRSFPKCLRWGAAAVTHGAGTDVRAWWPACDRFEPKKENQQ